jgi:multicomponent K+:H+ antiporter subunit A
VVEVVTTVLILLGLRWLPRRIEEVSPLPSSLLRKRVRRLRDLLLSIGGRRRHGAAVLRDADAADAQRHFLVLPQPGHARGRWQQRGQRDAGGLPVASTPW